MKQNVQNSIQRIVVNTSFFPFTHLYQKIYDLSIAVAVLLLKRAEGVAAIYLRRGVGQGEIVYGLSDIDLSVILNDQDEDEEASSVKEKVRVIYNRLSHLIPLFGGADSELGVYSVSEFLELHDDYDFHRYRLNRGKYKWKLLFGRDIVKTLPELPDSELRLPATEELKVWWEFLVVEFARSFPSPGFKKKYLWYKAISEAARVYLFACCGKNSQNRESALNEVKNYLPDETRRHIDVIKDYRTNLNSPEDLLPDELIKLYVHLASKTFKEAETKVYGQTKGRAAILNFPTTNDPIANRNATGPLGELMTEISSKLETYLEYIALIPQIEFNADVYNNSDIDSFYLVVSQKNWIPVEKLKEIRLLFEQCMLRQEIEPFTVVDNDIAFSLRADKPLHSIKSGGMSPLFFSLLRSGMLKPGQPLFRKKTETIHCHLPPQTFEETIHKRARKISKVILDNNIYKLKTLSFLRFFWAAARTKLLARSLDNNDAICIPITSRQILDMLIKSFPDDSDWLKRLHTEYINELLGEENESHYFFTKSIAFLNRV